MSSLDLVLYGGAPIMPSLLDRIDREWPATVRHIYGTTEIMCALYNPEPVGRPVTWCSRGCLRLKVHASRIDESMLQLTPFSPDTSTDQMPLLKSCVTAGTSLATSVCCATTAMWI
jgi:acyl-coenzyme A synthetase/AMP-(fatty) acid ligase